MNRNISGRNLLLLIFAGILLASLTIDVGDIRGQGQIPFFHRTKKVDTSSYCWLTDGGDTIVKVLKIGNQAYLMTADGDTLNIGDTNVVTIDSLLIAQWICLNNDTITSWPTALFDGENLTLNQDESADSAIIVADGPSGNMAAMIFKQGSLRFDSDVQVDGKLFVNDGTLQVDSGLIINSINLDTSKIYFYHVTGETADGRYLYCIESESRFVFDTSLHILGNLSATGSVNLPNGSIDDSCLAETYLTSTGTAADVDTAGTAIAAALVDRANVHDTLTKSFVVASIEDTHDFPFWMTIDAITIIAANGVCIAGTNVVGCLMEYDNDGANPVVCNSSDWTFTTGEERTTSVSNPSIDAGDYLGWKTTSVSGTVTSFTLTIEYTVN